MNCAVCKLADLLILIQRLTFRLMFKPGNEEFESWPNIWPSFVGLVVLAAMIITSDSTMVDFPRKKRQIIAVIEQRYEMLGAYLRSLGHLIS
jgi:hypothetical protein